MFYIFTHYHNKEYSGTSFVSVNLKQLVNIFFLLSVHLRYGTDNDFPPQHRKIRFWDKVFLSWNQGWNSIVWDDGPFAGLKKASQTLV